MPHYKHIIWDWNGTLLNDIRLSVDVINQLLLKYQKPAITPEMHRRLFDFPVRDYYLRLGFDFKMTPFEEVGGEFIQEYSARWRECRLHAHAVQVLRFFQAQGLTQSILSAAEVQMVKAGADHFGITHYFTELAGLDHHYAPGKEDIARRFMQKLGVRAGSVLLIGDTTHDWHVAQDIGVDCILFSGGHHPMEKLATCQVPLIDDLRLCQNFV